jgi:hypothetical protein
MTRIVHYYGDTVRQLLVGGVALMLLAAPFYNNGVPSALTFEIVGALIAVALAALTNPHNRWVMIGNAIVSGVGVVIFETWAIMTYDSGTGVAFVLREALAIVSLFAFYFSVKTVRAFVLGQIGKGGYVAPKVNLDEERDFEEESGAEAVREGRTESWIRRDQ